MSATLVRVFLQNRSNERSQQWSQNESMDSATASQKSSRFDAACSFAKLWSNGLVWQCDE
jgi:hypothetical protein